MNSPADGIFIGGVRVQFPVKPYPSQIAMMGQIIKGLKQGRNCLLESPTGTGKSLALLCSTLAWQEAEHDRVQRYNSLIDQGITDPVILDQIFSNNSTSVSSALNTANAPQFQQVQTPGQGQNPEPNSTAAPTLGHDREIPGNAQERTNENLNGQLSEGGFMRDSSFDADFQDSTFQFQNNDIPTHQIDGGVDAEEQIRPHIPRKRTPKIFFGTRTHKQIYQIVRELRRTKYSSVPSVILGSREQYCIHPVVSKLPNKNEKCQNMRDNVDEEYCSFYHGATKITTHDQMIGYGLQKAWDVEDLVRSGKRARACPYYISRQLLEQSCIVFGPYNYFVDPLIRKTMKINLHDHIVILDEAHNIEDTSRDAASLSVSQEQILSAKTDLERLIYVQVKVESVRPLVLLLSNLSMFMDSLSAELTDFYDFNQDGKILSGHEMAKHLSNIDVNLKALGYLKECLSEVMEDDNPNREQQIEQMAKASNHTSSLLSALFYSFNFLLDGEARLGDFKVALIKKQLSKSKFKRKSASGWFGKSDKPLSEVEYSLNMWCLNPGVAFQDLGNSARSVILTSGTLSPFTSFESELETKFPIKLEANHVIKPEQCWIGTISRGPSNLALNCTYKNTEQLGFQDELGRVVLETCKTIPGGVLCFMPSYSMLDKMVYRWESSGLWDKIKVYKVAVVEPRTGPRDFEENMNMFYDAVKQTKGCTEGVNGGVFFAVYRGKVSEGLDFSDDNARAVIAIGIPYPNFKDIQVTLKKQYNDMNCRSKALLPGRDWYEIQAYRALNQALGRCIRHKTDWGAILLVDERFSTQNRYTNSLSKWVRNGLKNHDSRFGEILNQLKSFTSVMQQKDLDAEKSICESNEPKISEEALKPKFESPPTFFKFEKVGENYLPLPDASGLPLPRDSELSNLPLSPIKNENKSKILSINSDENLNVVFNETSEVKFSDFGPVASTQKDCKETPTFGGRSRRSRENRKPREPRNRSFKVHRKDRSSSKNKTLNDSKTVPGALLSPASSYSIFNMCQKYNSKINTQNHSNFGTQKEIKSKNNGNFDAEKGTTSKNSEIEVVTLDAEKTPNKKQQKIPGYDRILENFKSGKTVGHSTRPESPNKPKILEFSSTGAKKSETVLDCLSNFPNQIETVSDYSDKSKTVYDYLSDDMFEETENNLSYSAYRKAKSRTPNPNLEKQNSAKCKTPNSNSKRKQPDSDKKNDTIIPDSDSDLDNFDLDTSNTGRKCTSATRSFSSSKKKGAHFIDSDSDSE